MKFIKPALTIEKQLDLLIQRGLNVRDYDRALHYLKHIGYYRLSGYLRPFLAKAGEVHEFKPGVEFEDALKIYIFDRKLRLHVLDAIERIEVAIRAQYSSIMSSKYGAHWYLDPSVFKENVAHDTIVQRIKDHLRHDTDQPGRRDVFIDHYFEKYSDPHLPPGWMVFEVLPFGVISKFFAELKREDKKAIADSFGLTHPTFKSWAHSLSALRNICAHHGRLWNRVFGIQPTRYGHLKEAGVLPNRFYAQAVVIKSMLDTIAPDSHWAAKLQNLLLEHPEVDHRAMGFPDDWTKNDLWGLCETPSTSK